MTRPDPSEVQPAIDDVLASAKPGSSADVVARELTFLRAEGWESLSPRYIVMRNLVAAQQSAMESVKASLASKADIPDDAKTELATAAAAADAAIAKAQSDIDALPAAAEVVTP
jgi:hypothetical protein